MMLLQGKIIRCNYLIMNINNEKELALPALLLSSGEVKSYTYDVQAWMDVTYEGKTFAEGAPTDNNCLHRQIMIARH